MPAVQKIDLVEIAKTHGLQISADGREILVPQGRIIAFGETELAFSTTRADFPAVLRHCAVLVFRSAKIGGTWRFPPDRVAEVLNALARVA